jgi:hypothetical protein
VHVVGGREDAVQVGESVVRGEGNELAAALERLAEEVEGVERVGEVSKDRPDSYAAMARNFLHTEPERRSPRRAREVSIAAPKEHFVELCCTPPPRDCPHRPPLGTLSGYNLSAHVGSRQKVGPLYCI